MSATETSNSGSAALNGCVPGAEESVRPRRLIGRFRPLNLTVGLRMRNWRHTVALPFLVALSGCIEVTTYVSPAASGTVIDATSKKPIQGATISVDNQPGLFAQTNADGQFTLPPTARTTHIFVLAPYRSLPPGGTIVVFADGYASREIVVEGGTDPLLVCLVRIR